MKTILLVSTVFFSCISYAFVKGYKLKTLEEVESHIQEIGHLLNIPSAKELTKNGVNLGEMDAKLSEKIEELIYVILSLISKSKNCKTL